MTYHWQSLDIPGRIEAIKAVYVPGDSASDIASRLRVTRNAVIGMYHRHRNKLERQPLGKPCGGKRRSALPVWIVPKAEPKPAPVPIMRPAIEVRPEPIVVGRTLMMLQRGQCKWPVNDAAKGEEHLFCGERAEGSYCRHHARRLVWSKAA